MAPLVIRLLGGFEIEADGTPITGVKTPRLQSVLAYLLLHHTAPQSRRHVAFTIWPDSSERQALSNLRKALYHLRRALPPNTNSDECWLHVDGHHVQWRPARSWSLDVCDFEDGIRNCLGMTTEDPGGDQQTAMTGSRRVGNSCINCIVRRWNS